MGVHHLDRVPCQEVTLDLGDAHGQQTPTLRDEGADRTGVHGDATVRRKPESDPQLACRQS